MKSFGPKKIQIPCTDQKVPFWQFFRKADLALFNLCMKIEIFVAKCIHLKW